MIIALEIAALLLVLLVVTPSLAHALEFPGKLRLSKEHYLAVQPIYYPGFTFVGAAEPLSAVALALLAWFGPQGSLPFTLVVLSLLAIICVNAIYWLVTHPVNRFWLSDTKVEGAGKTFFGLGAGAYDNADWKSLRNLWEYSHATRAAFALIAFFCLATAVALN